MPPPPKGLPRGGLVPKIKKTPSRRATKEALRRGSLIPDDDSKRIGSETNQFISVSFRAHVSNR